MPLVTPISLTLSNGFVQWSRDANEVEIDPNDSTADQVSAIYSAVNQGYPISFQRGAIYDDLPAFDFYTAIPYIAWYGDATKSRPRLRWSPGATHGFYLQWMKTTNTTGFKFIGLDCDGSNTGTYLPYTNWVKPDFMCLHMRRNAGSSTTSHAGIVVEDNIFRRWDESILIADDKLRGIHNTIGAGDTEGAFEFAIRRNLFLDQCGGDNHSIAVYIEGAKNGSIIEQNYFSYTGYLRDYDRNQPDFNTPSNPIADKRSHAIYWQFINGEGVIRENIMYQQGANMAQHRTPGIFDYNVGFYCAMTNNTGDVGGEGGHTGSSRVRGNLFGHQVNINNLAPDTRGAGWEMNRSPGGLTIDQNIAFDRQGTATGGGGIGMNVFNAIDSIDANVFVDWAHTGGSKESNGTKINVTGLTMNVNGTYREIRANPPSSRPEDQKNPAYVEQKPGTYPDNYQVPRPSGGYTQWPDITPERDELLRQRRLGEWRAMDHVSAYIDPARALARAAVLAEYGVTETALDPVTWSTNDQVNNGIGGNQDDTPINLSPDGYGDDDNEPAQPPVVSAGPDINTTDTLVGPFGQVTDPLDLAITRLWTQVSGPNTATIDYPTSFSPLIYGLVPGTYVFRLTATNSAGASASDDVQVVVSSAPEPLPDTSVSESGGYGVNQNMSASILTTGDSTNRDDDIQDAISAATADEYGVKHISFGSGVFYIEQVLITSKVRITGQADTTIYANSATNGSPHGLCLLADGSEIVGPIGFNRQDKKRMIRIAANGCSVRGVTITGDPATTGDATDQNILVDEGCTGAFIFNNDITHGGLGIYLSRYTDDCVIARNRISSIEGQHGIYANHGSNQRFIDNVISDFRFQAINLQVDRAGETMASPVVHGNKVYGKTVNVTNSGNGIGFNIVTGLDNCSITSPSILHNRVYDVAGNPFRWAAPEANDAISDVTFKNNSWANTNDPRSTDPGESGTVLFAHNQFTTRYGNRLFAEDWADTSAWTFDAGDDSMAGVSGGVLTVTNTAAFGMTTTSDVLPTDEPYTVEFITKPDTGSVGGTYKWRVQFITGTGDGTVRGGVYFDDTDLELSDGTTDTDVAPPDWAGANTRVRIIMWVDPVNLKARAFMLHMGTAPDDEYDALKPETGGSRATYEAQNPVEITLAAAPTKIRLATGGTNGVSTIESIEVWPLGTPGKGDSILTGSGEPNYAPVPDQPSRSEDPDGTLLEQLEMMLGTSERLINLGKGGDTLRTHVEPTINDFFCLSSGRFILWCGTNDMTGTDLDDMKTAMENIISKADAAGIILYVCNTIPRNAFSSTTNEKLLQWNSYLSRRIPQAGHIFVDMWTDMKDPSDSTQILGLYDDDGVHPSDEGYGVCAKNLLDKIGTSPSSRRINNIVGNSFTTFTTLEL